MSTHKGICFERENSISLKLQIFDFKKGNNIASKLKRGETWPKLKGGFLKSHRIAFKLQIIENTVLAVIGRQLLQHLHFPPSSAAGNLP